MRATAINHVSIPATDLAESARFYTELFGMEIVPSPNFGMAVTWLRVGDRQIHLFEAGPGEAALLTVLALHGLR
ncbi:MAG: VOC family protein, partial [Gaiellales bacterium]